MTYHVSVQSYGIGDVVCALFVVEGLMKLGHEVLFYSHQPHWARLLSRAECLPFEQRPDGCIELYDDYNAELKNRANRKEWYASRLPIRVTPTLPTLPDVFHEITHKPIYQGGTYVLMFPWAAWQQRQWSEAHWIGLCNLLKDRFDIVTADDKGGEAKIEQWLPVHLRYWNHPPEDIINLICHAVAVVGNDSGMAHVAGVFNRNTFAIHSQISSESLFSHSMTKSIMPDASCVGCFFQNDYGYVPATCDRACWTLQSVSPQVAAQQILTQL